MVTGVSHHLSALLSASTANALHVLGGQQQHLTAPFSGRGPATWQVSSASYGVSNRLLCPPPSLEGGGVSVRHLVGALTVVRSGRRRER